MSWWQGEGVEDLTSVKRGIAALGAPCLWRIFGIECELCQKARRYYDAGDEEMGRTYWPKRTPLALAWLFSDHEMLEEVNGKLVVIALPIDQVVGKIVERLREGSWENDPSDLKKGFVVTIQKSKPKNSQFPKWSIGKGKALPVKREVLIEHYKRLNIPNPKQDKGGFLDWLYNRHPELVVVSGTDIPLDTPVGLRLVPWPFWVEGEPKLEPEVDPKSHPIKVLRFHWKLESPTVAELKEKAFDPTALDHSKENGQVEQNVSLDLDEI